MNLITVIQEGSIFNFILTIMLFQFYGNRSRRNGMTTLETSSLKADS